MRVSVLFAILWAACSGSSGPSPVYPSVLLYNDSLDSVFVIWTANTGVDTVSVAPYRQGVCTHWTRAFDSLYTKVIARPDTSVQVVSPWLHAAQYALYFQVDTLIAVPPPSSAAGQPEGFAQHIATTEC